MVQPVLPCPIRFAVFSAETDRVQPLPQVGAGARSVLFLTQEGILAHDRRRVRLRVCVLVGASSREGRLLLIHAFDTRMLGILRAPRRV